MATGDKEHETNKKDALALFPFLLTDGLERRLERGDGVGRLDRLVPAERGVDELDNEEDAGVEPVLDAELDDDAHPDHQRHGLVELCCLFFGFGAGVFFFVVVAWRAGGEKKGRQFGWFCDEGWGPNGIWSRA